MKANACIIVGVLKIYHVFCGRFGKQKTQTDAIIPIYVFVTINQDLLPEQKMTFILTDKNQNALSK